jgi:hypothetical protein
VGLLDASYHERSFVAPMSEVAQLLCHVDQATSSIYAAADVAAVAALAQPWPEVRR